MLECLIPFFFHLLRRLEDEARESAFLSVLPACGFLTCDYVFFGYIRFRSIYFYYFCEFLGVLSSALILKMEYWFGAAQHREVKRFVSRYAHVTLFSLSQPCVNDRRAFIPFSTQRIVFLITPIHCNVIDALLPLS